jgi:hypothetical protein
MQLCLVNNLKVFNFIGMAYYVEEPLQEEAGRSYSPDLSALDIDYKRFRHCIQP